MVIIVLGAMVKVKATMSQGIHGLFNIVEYHMELIGNR